MVLSLEPTYLTNLFGSEKIFVCQGHPKCLVEGTLCFLFVSNIPAIMVLYILNTVSSCSGWSSNNADFTFFIPITKRFSGNLE